MENERKLAIAMARQDSLAKDHRRRRHLGIKRQELADGLTLREFRKKFPQLPESVWYARRVLFADYDW